MSDFYRDDDQIQVAARNLFMGCAPERSAELEELWKELSPKFRMTGEVHEGERFILDAGAFRYVRFNHRAMRAFWLAGFIAWEAYREIAECASLDQVDLTRFNELMAVFDQMISSDESDEVTMPKGVAEPGNFPDQKSDPQGRAASELSVIATGWALLHEIRHIKHQQEGTSADIYEADPSKRHAEEMSCDAYATEFLLNKIDLYAEQTGDDVAKVRQKRCLGIYIALFAMAVLARDNWDATNSHPSVQDRINAICSIMSENTSGLADPIAHTFFAVLRTKWPAAPGVFIRNV